MSLLSELVGAGSGSSVPTQRGTITITGTSALTGDATITAVTTGTAKVRMLGFTIDSSSSQNDIRKFPYLVLLNSTTVRATIGVAMGSGTTLTVSFEVDG